MCLSKEIALLGISVAAFKVSSQDEFRCYDCNSGYDWFHKDCPIDGNVNPEKITTVPCSERCFSRTNKWTPGVIHRGCSSNYYLPRPGLPESGCVRDPNENWWCFCTSYACNTDDMNSYV